MYFKFFLTLILSMYVFTSEAFIINNKSGKKLAVFFHQRNQKLPSDYYIYRPGRIRDGVEENPITNFEEPKFIIVGQGVTELKFQDNCHGFIIVDHELASEHKIEFNGIFGNVHFIREPKKIYKIKSASVYLQKDFQKLKSDATVLEVTLDAGLDRGFDGYDEFIKWSLNPVENRSVISTFVHEVIKLCTIL